MDIDRVRYFHAFAETGSLVAASEILGISQPALSKAVKLLEQEVGAQLVESDGRGLRLTSTGMLFKQETQGLLRSWLAIPEKLRLGQAATTTRIGSFEVFTTYFLALITKYVELAALELHEYGPGHLEDAIAADRVDLGITYVPIPKAGIEFIEVTKIRMGVFGLKKFQHVKLDALPFAVPLQPAAGTPSKVIGLDGWPDHKFRRLIRYRVSLMESAIELCRQGRCVAYLPEFVVKLHNENVLPEFRLHAHESPVSAQEKRQAVYLVQRKPMAEDRLHRQIAKALRAINAMTRAPSA